MNNEQNIFFVGHTRFDRWSAGVICLFVIACFFLPLYIGWGPLELMFYFYLGLCFIFTFPLRLFLQTFHNLYLYREGIEIYKPFKPAQFLFWDEIAQVRGSVWSSHLIISNRQGTVSCGVDSSHSNTSVLLHLLLYARPDLFHADRRLTFTLSPLPVIFLAVILGDLALAGINGGFANSYGIVSLILLVFCLVINVGLFMVIPYSLSLLGDQLVFRYPFHKAVLSAADVAYINKTTRFDLIFEWGEVTIHHKNGHITFLMFYNLGVSLLYAFLTYWQQVASTPRLGAGDVLESTTWHGHRRLSENAPYLLPARINAAKG